MTPLLSSPAPKSKNLSIGLSNWKAAEALWSAHEPTFLAGTSATRAGGEILNYRLGCLKLLDFAEALVLSPIEWFLYSTDSMHEDAGAGDVLQCHYSCYSQRRAKKNCQ